MRILLTFLITILSFSFAAASDIEKGYNSLLALYKNSSWQQEKCYSGNTDYQIIYNKYITACYNAPSPESDFILVKEVYNQTSFEEVYNIKTNMLQSEVLPKLKYFPLYSIKYDDYTYFYYGAEGLYIYADICEYLYTKNEYGFVEVTYFCSF